LLKRVLCVVGNMHIGICTSAPLKLLIFFNRWHHWGVCADIPVLLGGAAAVI